MLDPSFQSDLFQFTQDYEEEKLTQDYIIDRIHDLYDQGAYEEAVAFYEEWREDIEQLSTVAETTCSRSYAVSSRGGRYYTIT